ncbi:hypothetical protein ACFQ4L_02410 [Lapidilactobacillus mulanensis]|uniref:HTH cro/C1-type domain-containing protein n=1 Tax=Lapidilactobacillus mulanensis TaxID=2485999 RepID=A0ABW4DN43_9LACO|nr:Rgg/GadR/MutR family transcriptional regulator [Lapidilactobacillus mulanensis]
MPGSIQIGAMNSSDQKNATAPENAAQNFGETAKKIRLSKGLKLAEVADEQLSAAALSKFENGKADLTLKKFAHLLDRLWTTPEEFTYRYLTPTDQFDMNGYPSMAKLLMRWIDIGNGVTLSASGGKSEQVNHAFQAYIDAARHNAENSDDQIVQFSLPFWQMMRQFVLDIQDGHFALPQPQYTQALIKYLYQLDDWNEFDLYLFTGFSVGMTDEESLNLFKLVQARGQKYLGFRSERDLLFRMIENQFNIEMGRQNYELAKYYLSIYHEHLQASLNSEHNISYLFDRGWLRLRTGLEEDGERDCQQVLTVVRFLELADLEKNFKDRLEFIHAHTADHDWETVGVFIN